MAAPGEPPPAVPRTRLHRERLRFVARLARMLETPMVALSAVWLLLFVLELTRGATPRAELASIVIWVLFIAQFALEFVVVPRKAEYLRHHWATGISLALPALRLVRLVRLIRVLRLARAARGVRLLRVLASINRGLRGLHLVLRRRRLGYVFAATVLVAIVGAAGMYAFERQAPGGPTFADYPTALWWTAMLLTTMGSEAWPHTWEGRLLCLLLATYAFSVFGYVTAALASFFVGQDREAAREH